MPTPIDASGQPLLTKIMPELPSDTQITFGLPRW